MNTKAEHSFATDVRSVFNALRSRWIFIALCTFCGVALAFLATRFMPNVYQAKTVVQVEQEEQKVVKIEGVKSEDLKSVELLKTFEQNVTSPEVLLRVIHNPELHDDARFLPEAKRRTDNALQEALTRHIDAKVRRGTRLIDITVTHRDPEMAQRIAALLVDEFVAWNSASRHEAGQSANRFLLEEAERLKAKLAKSEEALQAYKEQNEAVSLEDKQNITVEKLKELNLRVTTAKAERLKLEPDYTYLNSPGPHTPEDLMTIGAIASAPAVVELKKSISEKEAHLATLKERYKPEHPKYVEAESELQNLRFALNAAVRRAGDVLTSNYQSASVTEEKLDEALREQQKRALELNKIAIPYTVLARDAESDRALFDSVLTRLKETKITSEISQDPIRVVARPLLPDVPVGSKRTQVLALGLLGGLALGSILAFLSNAVASAFSSVRDAETRLGLRALAEIPKLSAVARRNTDPSAIFSDSAATEAFRGLRATLALARDEAGPRSYLFTSALQGEGKTFCAVNCAISFAHAGLKTLLIDADLRQPQLARIFSLSTAAAGEVQVTEIAHLSLTSASEGNLDANSLLTGSAFESLMQRAMQSYDRVIVDTAPVNLFSDTLLLARYVQSVCLVVHADKTPADEVLRAADRLADANASPMGFIWNQAKTTATYYYNRPAQREGSNVLRAWFGGERTRTGSRAARVAACTATSPNEQSPKFRSSWQV